MDSKITLFKNILPSSFKQYFIPFLIRKSCATQNEKEVLLCVNGILCSHVKILQPSHFFFEHSSIDSWAQSGDSFFKEQTSS